MKISAILEHIDCGHVALPDFKRGYVCNRDRVRTRLVPCRFRAILHRAMEAA